MKRGVGKCVEMRGEVRRDGRVQESALECRGSEKRCGERSRV